MAQGPVKLICVAHRNGVFQSASDGPKAESFDAETLGAGVIASLTCRPDGFSLVTIWIAVSGPIEKPMNPLYIELILEGFPPGHPRS
jgi:hypothetical protein